MQEELCDIDHHEKAHKVETSSDLKTTKVAQYSCAECCNLKALCDSLRQKLEGTERQLKNAKNLNDSLREFCTKTREKQVESERKAVETTQILGVTKERFGHIEYIQRVADRKKSLELIKKNVLKAERKVRDLRSNPYSSATHLKKAKETLRALQNDYDSSESLLQSLHHTKDLCEKLVKASCINDAETVEFIVKKGIGVNTPDETGNSAFKYACGSGSVAVIKVMLNRCLVDINHCDQRSETPLILAIQKNHPDIVSVLLENGANVDCCTRCGLSPLHVACKEGNFRSAELLVNFGANLNIVDKHGETPLFYCARSNNLKIGRLLLRHNADCNIENFINQNALDVAKRSGAKDVITELVQYSLY